MNVLVCVENHFTKVGTDYYEPVLSPGFFQRYREVWDEVVILGRCALANRPPPAASPHDFTGVRLVGLPDFLGPRQYLRHRPEIKSIARRILSKVDSIMLRVPGTIGSVVWREIRHSGRPYGIEVLADPIDGFSRGAVHHPLRPFFRWLLPRELKLQCHEAFSTAYVTARALQHRYPPNPDRFTTDYSDVTFRDDQILQQPREITKTQGTIRLVHVGNFGSMYKAQDIIIKALARAVKNGWDLELVFIGAGQHLVEMQQLAEQCGMAGRVHFRGAVPPGEAVFAEFDQAQLFLLPSRSEGLPRALIEAMARGLPCIGSTVGGITELLEPEELVPPNDVVALEKKIIEVLSDPARMARLSKRNLAIAAGYTESDLRVRRLAFYKSLRAGTETWMQNEAVEQQRGLKQVSSSSV